MRGHTPVLLDEVIQFLDPKPGGRFIDATLGAGGHTRAILERSTPDGKVLAIDQDESALAGASETLASFGSRLAVVHSSFKDIGRIAAENGFLEADGVLADIGISSMMIDDPARGFSFMREGPLDMRMDQSRELTAADVVNTYSEKEIADILYKYGEERRSRAIARELRCASAPHGGCPPKRVARRWTSRPSIQHGHEDRASRHQRHAQPPRR